jgi:uncharacterized SAM-binding protein YcdF (DUF218 family)
MDDPKLSPFKLTQSRIILLIFGVLALLIIASTLLGGLGYYQTLREANAAAVSQPQ